MPQETCSSFKAGTPDTCTQVKAHILGHLRWPFAMSIITEITKNLPLPTSAINIHVSIHIWWTAQQPHLKLSEAAGAMKAATW